MGRILKTLADEKLHVKLLIGTGTPEHQEIRDKAFGLSLEVLMMLEVIVQGKRSAFGVMLTLKLAPLYLW